MIRMGADLEVRWVQAFEVNFTPEPGGNGRLQNRLQPEGYSLRARCNPLKTLSAGR